MADRRPENPPAFPVMEEMEQWDEDAAKYVSTFHPCGGMSLRDYFAAQALITAGPILAAQMDDWRDGEHSAFIARRCYAMADAMLREREKVSHVS